MRFLSLVGNSFGCSASGERLVSAARDGDFQEAKALLEYNPRLARYSTFGVRNSPLHYSAAQGHHEIVSLLLESGVDIDLRNYRGQTALMQACQYGHWEVVQTLILFRPNIHQADFLNGGTALHLAALNGHSRCIRLLLSDYIPSVSNFCSLLRKRSKTDESFSESDACALYEVINRPADGGVTALHMAALNGHFEAVQLLLDLGASVSDKTVKDGTTIDLIVPLEAPGAVPQVSIWIIRVSQLSDREWLVLVLPFLCTGSTPLHYAACGGNAQCCQLLIARGASLTAENANGWTPLMVARSWHRDLLEEVLTRRPTSQPKLSPSPYLCLPLMSIIYIARQCGWRGNSPHSTCLDPCVVCLERKCTVAAEGCLHEFCIQCALYLCSTNNTSSVAQGPPGSITCPLCRHGIVSFIKFTNTGPLDKEIPLTSLSLPFCTCSAKDSELTTLESPLCRSGIPCARLATVGSFRSLNCQRFPSVKFNSRLCMGGPDASPSRKQLDQCLQSNFRRSTSESEGRRWLCSLSQSVATSSSC